MRVAINILILLIVFLSLPAKAYDFNGKTYRDGRSIEGDGRPDGRRPGEAYILDKVIDKRIRLPNLGEAEELDQSLASDKKFEFTPPQFEVREHVRLDILRRTKKFLKNVLKGDLLEYENGPDHVEENKKRLKNRANILIEDIEYLELDPRGINVSTQSKINIRSKRLFEDIANFFSKIVISDPELRNQKLHTQRKAINLKKTIEAEEINSGLK